MPAAAELKTALLQHGFKGGASAALKDIKYRARTCDLAGSSRLHDLCTALVSLDFACMGDLNGAERLLRNPARMALCCVRSLVCQVDARRNLLDRDPGGGPRIHK